MKQILVLFLALSLTLSLAACGASGGAGAGPAPADMALRGSFAGGVYRSEALRLQIALPKFWSFCGDAQIAELNGLSAEALAESDITELIAEQGCFLSMMMTDPGGNTLNLILQPGQPGAAGQSDEQLFALAEQSLRNRYARTSVSIDRRAAQYDCAMRVRSYTPTSLRLGDGEQTALHLLIDVVEKENNYLLYSFDQYQLWYRPDGDYMGVLTLAITDGSDPQPILDGIAALHEHE